MMKRIISDNPPWVVRPLVPKDVYTDRDEFLDYLHKAALDGARRLTMSTVLLGQRRMGKTEIFKRVVNRLFFEQDPKSPDAVIPVYFSFPDGQLDKKSFALKYLENFMKYYVGFLTGQPELITGRIWGEALIEKLKASRSLHPFSNTFDLLFTWHGMIHEPNSVWPHQIALEAPRTVADLDESTIVIFLDEFQNTRLPQYGFDIAGFMQEAVESPTCPHFVTGSAMSILAREIIGRGSLFGRFDSLTIESMSGYWGAELARKSAQYRKTTVSELMAPVVAERCGGNPFYINAVIRQAAKQNKTISDEETLNKLLAVDLASGFIWGELNDQVEKWISRINDQNITKWILYLSALDENTETENRDRINVERIHQELVKREGKEVSLDLIRDVLIKLSRGDLLEYLEFGDWFRRVKDPILLEFLKVWGKIEVEGHDAGKAQNELAARYSAAERKIREYKGYLAEVHLSQILVNGQQKVLNGRFFNSAEDVRMPDRFIFIRHRYRPESGKGREIDVLAAAGGEVWVCQSKWVKGKKIGVSVLRDMLSQAETVKRELKPQIVRLWLFAHDGLTKQAEAFAKQHSVLWSGRREFDALLEDLGLRKLPKL